MLMNRVCWIGAMIVLVALTGCQTYQHRCPTPALEVYPCRAATGPIAIDGKLDEAAWGQAEVISEYHVFQAPPGVELSPSNVRLLWNKDFLYVAFEYEDNDIWSFSNTPDDDLWNGDVAELFIKPSTTNNLYYEFVMAPNGNLFDARYPSRGAGGSYRFKVWSSGAQVATDVRGTDNDFGDDDQGYTVEMAIPMSVFPDWAQPSETVGWTFGAFRYNYSKSFEDPLLLMSVPEAVGHGYHSYEDYQPLRFSK
ncbi:MAG TPA: carbohydrate-binding family 9-like protein [Candidatus Hydrogenedentes bacterium]|nr:carbohydrate-binding family 9-like protein [Candidatus Hydrogenedentota bacterium]